MFRQALGLTRMNIPLLDHNALTSATGLSTLLHDLLLVHLLEEVEVDLSEVHLDSSVAHICCIYQTCLLVDVLAQT